MNAENTYVFRHALLREAAYQLQLPGDRQSEGVALGNLASLFAETGRLEQAERTFQHALSIHRQLGNRRFEGIHNCSYALCLLAMGRRREAAENWRQGMKVLTELHDDQAAESLRGDMQAACQKAGEPSLEAGPA
ncbi:MAG: tetratricopeptide repeat protein [Planctomycetota bacterium]